MAKGRVSERSQTGALHTTPVGDRVAGTRGLTTPGSGDYLKEKASAEAGSARMSLLILVSIFLSAAFLSEEERVNMKVPRDMDDAKALEKVLSKYKDTFFVQVLVAYFATYIFLQTFAILGSIFLSILSGFLYPFPLALFLVCLCSELCASFCYMLSYVVGRPVVYKYLTEKAVKWSQQFLLMLDFFKSINLKTKAQKEIYVFFLF
uniref:Transmembrane protein 41B n=1 Tax=Suricata suricatta TaxID=37032 RepID=A0A673TAM0_SURSU